MLVVTLAFVVTLIDNVDLTGGLLTSPYCHWLSSSRGCEHQRVDLTPWWRW